MMTKRDHADGRDIDARADECRFLANKRSSDRLRATSGLPPTGNIRWPMSVIVLISSALPPAPDVGGTPGECLNLTQPGRCDNLVKSNQGRFTMG